MKGAAVQGGQTWLVALAQRTRRAEGQTRNSMGQEYTETGARGSGAKWRRGAWCWRPGRRNYSGGGLSRAMMAAGTRGRIEGRGGTGGIEPAFRAARCGWARRFEGVKRPAGRLAATERRGAGGGPGGLAGFAGGDRAGCSATRALGSAWGTTAGTARREAAWTPGVGWCRGTHRCCDRRWTCGADAGGAVGGRGSPSGHGGVAELVVRHVIIFGHGHGLQRAIIDESQHRTPERLIMAQH